jgi:hypothetical protein
MTNQLSPLDLDLAKAARKAFLDVCYCDQQKAHDIEEKDKFFPVDVLTLKNGLFNFVDVKHYRGDYNIDYAMNRGWFETEGKERMANCQPETYFIAVVHQKMGKIFCFNGETLLKFFNTPKGEGCQRLSTPHLFYTPFEAASKTFDIKQKSLDLMSEILDAYKSNFLPF